MRRFSAIICLILGVAVLSGCFARGGVMGDSAAVYATDVPRVHAAVIAVLQADGLSVTKDESDAVSAVVVAQYADDTTVTLHAERTPDGGTELTIQVGTFGDAERSAYLHQQIGTRLQIY